MEGEKERGRGRERGGERGWERISIPGGREGGGGGGSERKWGKQRVGRAVNTFSSLFVSESSNHG